MKQTFRKFIATKITNYTTKVKGKKYEFEIVINAAIQAMQLLHNLVIVDYQETIIIVSTSCMRTPFLEIKYIQK